MHYSDSALPAQEHQQTSNFNPKTNMSMKILFNKELNLTSYKERKHTAKPSDRGPRATTRVAKMAKCAGGRTWWCW
jgi:hypothetical protein